jgi:glycosyltransferase involved in cell wall biosynthesis
MRVLIFHGYLLAGTGSNVYNSSLARALAGLGHEVHLLCQDRDASLSAGPGSITIHNPEIGGLLPVYVRDRYEGFEVKTFPELTDAELDLYIDANVAAVREVAARAGEIDAALANHLVMGPAILARAGLRCGFAAKVHGSALEYTVRPNPRFLPYAREGMAAANGVLVGSRHTAESLWRTVADPALPAKTRLGPPGVDVELFHPRERAQADEALLRLAAELKGQAPNGAFGRQPPRAAAALREFAAAPGYRVLFVGKLIEQKGVDLLLRAWPAVVAANPDARLLIAGFGEDEDTFTALADESVLFSGRLEHDEVAVAMAAADALVMPSVFPEAFGMVAAEAAATGALPISADHSGMREVSRRLAARLPAQVAGLVSFPVDENAPEAIAERLNAWLALEPALRERSRRVLAETVADLWSWEGVARGVLRAAAGDLDDLAEVPADVPE